MEPKPTIGRMEPDYLEDFRSWKASPSPTTSSKMLQRLDPVINRGIQAYVGNQASPNIRSRAKQLALQALHTYDPEQAKLGTHVMNHLQGLRRISRQSQQILRVPERVVMDQAFLNEQKAQLTDSIGREPSVEELADHTGLSMKRIKYLHQFQRPLAEGTLSGIVGEEGESGGFSPAVVQAPSEIYLETLYGDLDGPNQKILEWTLGMHGQKRLSNQQIAAKLNLSPGAISQRKALLQSKLDEMHDLRLF